MERMRIFLGKKLKQAGETMRSQSPEAAESMRKTRVDVQNEILDDDIEKRIDEITGIILSHKSLGFTELFPHLNDTQSSLFFANTKKELLRFFVGRENKARVDNTKRSFTNEELLGLRRLLPITTATEETNSEYYSRKMAEDMIHGMFYQQPKGNTQFTNNEYKRLAGFFHYENPYRLSDEVYAGGKATLEQYAEKLNPATQGLLT